MTNLMEHPALLDLLVAAKADEQWFLTLVLTHAPSLTEAFFLDDGIAITRLDVVDLSVIRGAIGKEPFTRAVTDRLRRAYGEGASFIGMFGYDDVMMRSALSAYGSIIGLPMMPFILERMRTASAMRASVVRT